MKQLASNNGNDNGNDNDNDNDNDNGGNSNDNGNGGNSNDTSCNTIDDSANKDYVDLLKIKNVSSWASPYLDGDNEKPVYFQLKYTVFYYLKRKFINK